MHICCVSRTTGGKHNCYRNRGDCPQDVSQNRLRFDHFVCFPLMSLTNNSLYKNTNVTRLIT
ncbi:hypothetical protein CO704_06855 [Cedecea neteri]|uniref:Uncharacterized protein n=1 Tax=Cedecea neteri TaxID=158822 RepID=A0A291DVJ0_9ENTR|nr:hypothetical protein CO704_06855 [Cedecea neteri]